MKESLRRMRSIALVIGLLGASGFLASCDIEAPGPDTVSVPSADGWKVAVGEKLPPFRLRSVDGRTVTLDDYRGKAVVLSLFATWCGPCREELPQIESRVWQTVKEKQVQVIAVSRGEGPDQVKPFLKEIPLTFPVLTDEEEEYSRKLAGDGIPRLLITDREHVIRHLELGYYPPQFSKVLKEIDAVAAPAR